MVSKLEIEKRKKWDNSALTQKPVSRKAILAITCHRAFLFFPLEAPLPETQIEKKRVVSTYYISTIYLVLSIVACTSPTMHAIYILLVFPSAVESPKT